MEPLVPFFLATKIAAPKVSPRWIARGRLIERLGVPPSSRVTVLQAGPGFGKTACLAQWQEALRAHGVRVAWLAVDPEDDDVATLLGYIAAALNVSDGAIGADVMELSRSGPMPRSAALLHPLLNQVAASGDRYVLIVDDLHHVRSETIDDVLSDLIAHAPDNLHVAIGARRAPNLRLGKLRAEGAVVELGAETLGLTRAETAALAEAALGASLSARDIAQLQAVSEGWPAALQMMLVALGSKKHLRNLVRGFSGDARILRDYLAQEAFEGLPADAQTFLIRTSVLGRFCAELCEKVSGIARSAATLADIEQRHPLVVALDARERWFRYHALFADFLQAQLEEREPGTAPALHARASEWFESAGLWGEAVRHALAAGDEPHAIAIIDRHAMPLIEHGEFVALIDWLGRFPEAAIESRPRLRAAQIWALALTMRHREALQLLQRLRESYGKRDADLAAEIRLIEGGVAVLRDDFSQLALLDSWAAGAGTGSWISDVHKTLAAYSLIVRGEYRQAREMPLCETPLKIAYQKMLVGLAWWHEGNGSQAEIAWADAVDYADQEFGSHSVTAALARAISARTALEDGRLLEAQEQIDQRLVILEQAAPLEWLWSAYATLAWAQFAEGRHEDGRSVLEHGCTLARQRDWSRMEAALIVDLLRLADTGKLGLLAAHAERLRTLRESAAPSMAAAHQTRYLCEIGLGYFEAATDRHDRAVERIASAVDTAPATLPAALRGQGLLMLAEALHSGGAREQAANRLAAAMQIGAGLGMGETFRIAARGLHDLLVAAQTMAAKSGHPPVSSFVSRMMSRPGAESIVVRSVEPLPLLESLSDRERAILLLVGRGMSNKEIGRGLHIGTETVKWHLKNLFGKLGVPNRIRAVNRARELAII